MLDSWDSFSNKSFSKIIFGSGHRASAIDRGGILSKTTHNEFFETMYSYGIFGLIFYLYIFITFYKIILEIKNNDPIIYDVGLSSIIMFFTLSFFTHLNLYPTYFAFILIAISLANAKKIKLNKN